MFAAFLYMVFKLKRQTEKMVIVYSLSPIYVFNWQVLKDIKRVFS